MTNKNDNIDKETLSQLMDGEWQDIDAAQSVKGVCSDQELSDKWSRYHIARDVMRKESISIDTELTSRIFQAIEDEPTYTNVSAINTMSATSATTTATVTAAATETKQKPSYIRTGLSGLALAACVAMATVIGLNVWQQGAPGADAQSIAGTPATTAVPGIVLPRVEYVSNEDGTHWVNPKSQRHAESESRLNVLLSNHIEASPTADRTGMLPYSRLVGYDTVAPE